MEEPVVRSSKRKGGDASITDIPDQILMEICARLSVKSICRCRCVCKHWFTVLRDSSFSKLHFKRSHVYALMKKDDRSRYAISKSKSLYLFEIEPDRDLCCYSNYHYPNDHGNLKFHAVFKLPNPAEKPSGMAVINSCNGFLCLRGVYNEYPVVIYNPVTGEYLTLPYPPLDGKKICVFFLHGLGFCSRSNQYKVLLTAAKYLYCKSCADSADCRNRVALVYTLGGGWIKVEKVPCFGCFVEGNSVFLNGALHWPVFDKNDSRRAPMTTIMSFDLEDEKFCSLETSDLSNRVGTWGKAGFRFLWVRLGKIRDQLYLVDGTYIPSGAKVEQWALKDFGAWNSTMKLVADVSAIGEDNARGFFFYSLKERGLSSSSEHEMLWCLKIGEIATPFRLGEDSTALKVAAFVPSFYSLKDIAAGSLKILNVGST